LDGHDNASFASIRGVKDAFDRSKQNLIDFLQLKVRTKSKTKVIVSMIHFDQNINSIQQIRAFWQSLPGVDQFQAKKFGTFNGDVEEIRFLDRGLKRMRKAPFVVCSRPWDMMTITWNGEVVPCCYDYDNKYVVGNANSNTLNEIWRSERMVALRREFISNTVTNSLCRSCPSLRGNIVSEGI
jgi:radical SAM protein with 4Fe4S-binding SPASM domain